MFNIVLTDGYTDIVLAFKVRNTPVAKKWFSELSKEYPLYETDRFTNWGDKNLIKDLKIQLDIIKNYDERIKATISDSITQSELNRLHKYFEDLRGEVTQGTPWYNAAPKKIQDALVKFNVLIHELEANLRTSNHPTMVVTFKERPIIELSPYDLEHFTFRWTSGTVYINYCHVGKTVLDVFKDRDSIAEAVRPQTHYSADFMVKFGPTTPYIKYLIKKIMIMCWLPFQKFKFKNSNIGMIPVADHVGNFNIDNVRRFNKVKRIVCKR